MFLFMFGKRERAQVGQRQREGDRGSKVGSVPITASPIWGSHMQTARS